MAPATRFVKPSGGNQGITVNCVLKPVYALDTPYMDHEKELRQPQEDHFWLDFGSEFEYYASHSDPTEVIKHGVEEEGSRTIPRRW